jgi:hypothetical protein
MALVDDYCKVTAQGVTHLFLGIDYGSVCVCGRKVFAFAVEDERPILRDRPLDETPSRLVAAGWSQALVPSRLGTPEMLLARGETEIHRGRQLREGIDAARVKRSFARTEALWARGTFLIRSAQRVCAGSAWARARRDSASGRRRLFAGGTRPDLRQGPLPDSEAALMQA